MAMKMWIGSNCLRIGWWCDEPSWSVEGRNILSSCAKGTLCTLKLVKYPRQRLVTADTEHDIAWFYSVLW